MTAFVPPNPDFEAVVRHIFDNQPALHTIGARLERVSPGEVTITYAYRPDLTQQHGFTHAGIVAMLADNACGCAAGTLLPPDCDVLTVEFKLNLMAPAVGETLTAIGMVKRAGRTLVICNGDVFATQAGDEKLVATILATVMILPRTAQR